MLFVVIEAELLQSNQIDSFDIIKKSETISIGIAFDALSVASKQKHSKLTGWCDSLLRTDLSRSFC